MVLKIKRDFYDRIEYLRVTAGSIIERDDARATELIASGVAAEAKPEPEKSERATKNKGTVKKSAAKK